MKKIDINSEKCIEYGNLAAVRLINHNVGALRTELLDVNINTGVQSINTERTSLAT